MRARSARLTTHLTRYAAVAAAVTLVTACADRSVSGPTPVQSASFAFTVDEDGNGFVGKGDVQYTFGWNNKQLQDNVDAVQFQFVSTVVTEVNWICTNSNNENTQERERTTTTTVEGLLESVARSRNQITGFYLEGFDGNKTESSTTEGNQFESCPSGPWTLTTRAGDPEVVSSSGGGLEVSGDGGATWTELLLKP